MRRRAAQSNANRTVGADGRAVQPSAEALAAAKARLEPPRAPWHPLPLAEIGIVLGMIAMVVAVARHNAVGASAGFTLILASTFEFSLREHRHGYRSHGALLSGIIALFVGLIAWRVLGLTRGVCLGIALVVFLMGFGLFDRAYIPARQRAAAEPGGEPPTSA